MSPRYTLTDLGTRLDGRIGPQTDRPLVAVVEDDVAVIRSLQFALEAEGYAVRAFESAHAYLVHSDLQPRCLVVDHGLPGVTGTELLELLERRGRPPPAVLIASNPDGRCRQWASAYGVPLVEKPFLSHELTDRIRAAVQA